MLPHSRSKIVGKADKDYFLNADGNLAESEDDAAFLLVRQGQDVTQEMADKYGIGKVAQEEQDAEPVEKAAKPASNKAKKPASNKGVKQ